MELVETNLGFLDLTFCAHFLDNIAITACFRDAGVDLKAYDAEAAKHLNFAVSFDFSALVLLIMRRISDKSISDGGKLKNLLTLYVTGKTTTTHN